MGAAGGVGVGAGLANVKTVRDSVVRRLMAIDPEMFLFGPDIGFLYRLLGIAYSENFGQEARITSVARTFVDPSAVGRAIRLNEREKVEAVELLQEITANDGRRFAAGTLVAKGEKEGERTILPPGTRTRVVTVTGNAERTVQVHGTRLPDGQIVPGREIVFQPEIL